MTTDPIILSFDGIDGVGKSTVARAVAKRLKREGFDVHYVHSPAAPYRTLKRVVEKSDHVRERYYFYLAGNYNLSERVRSEQLQSGSSRRITVVDRYLYSTYAHHVIQDRRIPWEGFASGLIVPLISFLVTVDKPEIQLDRLRMRDGRIDNQEVMMKTWKLIADEFSKMTMVPVDNSSQKPRPCVEDCMRIISARLSQSQPNQPNRNQNRDTHNSQQE